MTIQAGRRSACWLIALLLLGGCGQVPVAIQPTIAVQSMANGSTPTLPDASATPDAGAQQVSIDNFTFAPAQLTIAAGTTVAWTNHDDIPHTVTSTNKRFSSAALDTDDRFAYRFTTPGTYDYYCTLHPKMTGTIRVQ